MANFVPLHDRIVLRRPTAEEKSSGGIIIPDTAKEKPNEAEVIAVGPGVRDEHGHLVPLQVKPGDRVLFGKWSGTEVKIGGEDLLIVKESDLFGIIAAA
jgi:chaperonin GroES